MDISKELVDEIQHLVDESEGESILATRIPPHTLSSRDNVLPTKLMKPLLEEMAATSPRWLISRARKLTQFIHPTMRVVFLRLPDKL